MKRFEEREPLRGPALLGQDFSIALQVQDPKKRFFHDPNLCRTAAGALLIAAPDWNRTDQAKDRRLRIARSTDGGQAWQELPSLPYEEGTPFVLGGDLFMFVQTESHKDVQIISSHDDGVTWSEPVTVLTGPLWNISTARVVRDEAMFWAMDYDLPGRKYGGKVMARMTRDRSPMDPGAWSLSNIIDRPELPALLSRHQNEHIPCMGWPFYWLEPNTVEVDGRIRVFCRCGIDSQGTTNMAAVLDYDPEDHRLEMTQLTAWPGGHCKFFILDDRPSGLYWMLGNLATNSQNLIAWDPQALAAYRGSPGNERRWMFLHYSLDCLNWFPAGCVAFWPDHISRSFMYPSAVVDGDDLVVLSRTSRDAVDQHDADLCTVHRIVRFRDLALPLSGGHPF